MRPTASCFLLLLVAAAMSLASHALQLRPPAAGACVPRERDALLAFKKGITKDPLGRLASWRRGEDCCRWRGVRCSNRTGHVLKLQLRYIPVADEFDDLGEYIGARMVGLISHSLLSLEHLEHLDVSMNSLAGPTGRLPEFLGSFKSLRYLNLSGIPFHRGMVPPQLGNLSNLHYLDLAGTKFSNLSTDLSWLTNLPSLHYLNLNGVNLSTAVDWPHIVNMIPSLRVIYLSGCQLQSANQSLPHLNLTKLEKLDLSWNYFNYHPSASCWFWNLTSLKHLDLHWSHLFGHFPDALGEMTSLQVFDYSYNQHFNAGNYSGTAIMAPNLLRNLCNLEILNLDKSLSSGNITELFESLLHCPSKKLRELHLSGNNITGTLPTGMAQFTSLATLDLFDNKLTGPVPSEITMLTNLTSMDLSRNDLHGVITEEHFAGLHSLKYIYLFDNHLKIVVGPEWLPPFRPEVIYFVSCQLGPQFPAWLQWLAGTDEIVISSNGITGQLPDWFSTVFSKTTYLDISNNRISGGLPPNMETMSLTRLFLGSNQLAGEIPPLPRNLIYLDISNNQLAGEIPPLPRNLTNLDLSNNALSGRVPGSVSTRSQHLTPPSSDLLSCQHLTLKAKGKSLPSSSLQSSLLVL